MSVTSQALRCFTPLSSSSSSSCFSSNYGCRSVPIRIARWPRSASVQEALPSQTKPPRRPTTTFDGDERVSGNEAHCSGIQVSRQKYICISKSELLDAIISAMFPSQEEARQFLSLSELLDSILHAEHKTILEEMRSDFDLTLSPEYKTVSLDHFLSFSRNAVADQAAFVNKSLECEDVDKKCDGGTDSKIQLPFGFTLDSNLVLDFSWINAKREPLMNSRVAIPGRFQRAFVKLLKNAEFEELSPRDLMLTSALNTDYLLTLPIYVDWKRASESSAIIFRRGYTTERQKGFLIVEKLDYLQSKLLQNIFLFIARPLGRLGVWVHEVFKSVVQQQDSEFLVYNIKRWLEELSVRSYDEKLYDGLKGIETLSSDLPIWVAAQKAVTRYEGILSGVGPRERLLRKFLAWIGLIPSTPEQAFDLHSEISSSDSNLSPSFLSRISLSDIWKPASPKSCGHNFRKMLKTAISILSSQSVLQEPAFQELILLYAEDVGVKESTEQVEVPLLQMKIYERIPIPDLPVVFPHKKLSFRIIDAVRLDIATILGLLAYFFSYKFEDILSSPSAILLDMIAASALIIYVTRVLLGYKQTRDRYELLVNRTLYEKTVASGFGSVHFLLDASEQQQYKEAILVYATILRSQSGQAMSTKSIGHKCETFVYNAFLEKVEMGVDKAVETLLRLGIVRKMVVDGEVSVQAMPCSRAYFVLRNHWNTLIN